MYCVIQEIETKKFNQNGYHKELIATENTLTVSGVPVTCYGYHYSGGRFDRPIRKAYKISIHESKRVNGVVTKKQYAITTARYYEVAEDWFTLYDYGDRKISKAAESLGVDPVYIYNLIEKKLDPLTERIQAEFAETEEYRVHQEHDRILTAYVKNKAEFAKEHGCDSSEYEYCYDVFGTLRNPEYLEKVKREAKSRRAYEESSRGYRESYYRNYTGGLNGMSGSSVSKENQEIFKQFYRTLSKVYHPDSNPDRDTSEEMKLLNQLKGEWGV